jgi:hypothetical protein
MIRIALFSLLAVFLCTSAYADSLEITATGTFSATDTPDTFVTPGDPFSLSFLVDTNPSIPPGDSTSLSFDVPVESFAYTVNGAPVNVTPSEITFYTAADGGGFAVQFSDAEFIFGNDQIFSATSTTSAPVFSTGSFSAQNFVFLDDSNVDSGASLVTLTTATPEPSFLPVLLCGGLALIAFRGRKFIQAR